MIIKSGNTSIEFVKGPVPHWLCKAWVWEQADGFGNPLYASKVHKVERPKD